MVPSRPSHPAWLYLACALSVGCGLTDEAQQQAPPPAQDRKTNPAVVPAPLPDNALGNPAAQTREPAASSNASTPPRLVTPEPLAPQQALAPFATSSQSAPPQLFIWNAQFRWPGHTPSLKFPNLEKEARDSALQSLGRELRIQLQSDGTMSMKLLGGVFALPQGSELQARPDRYGHLLVWPDGKTYRVLPQGSLPALLQERRPDVVPLVHANVANQQAHSTRRFGFEVTRFVLEANRGSIELDTLEVPETGAAGVPLCRFLLELLALAPHPEVCAPTRSIVRARYEVGGAALEFELTALSTEPEESAQLTVPPSKARFVERGLPPGESPLPLAEFAHQRKPQQTGFLEVTNSADVAGWLLLDSNPVGFLPPHSKRRFGPLPAATFHVELRDFFGAHLVPAGPANVLELTKIGAPPDADAGGPAPDDQSPNSAR